MAAIFQIRRGTTNASPTLQDGELYLHQGSGSIQFGSGSTKYNTLTLDAPVKGDINLIGNISASGDVRIGGNIYLGDGVATDNISALGVFTTNLVPTGLIDLGTTSAKWNNVFANNISGAIAATNGVISGSSQITYTSISSIPSGIVSGSTQVTPLLPTGVVSGSAQTILNLPTGTVSGSSQITYENISSIPSGIVSGAAQIPALLPTGIVSGSSQVITSNAITLGTHTTGNYIQTITGTANQITVAGSGLESADVTLSTPQDIHTSANVQFNSIGVGIAATAVAGEIRAINDITAFYSSDVRLKENIVPIENALSKVESISGNTYDWKEGFEEIHSHKGNDIGVIAQEIEAVLPQIVISRDNGFKAVQYEKIIPLLIEAIKELSAKIKDLENK
jgi:cytoskeletal protein CcmA (bactofilin family)